MGSAADDIIMASFEMAASDGADVISMSAGYANIWEKNSPYTSLMQGLLDKGVGLVIAAGNDGGRGPFFASTPALVSPVIAVGSNANTKFTTVYHAKDSANQTVEFGRIVPIEDDESDFHVFTVPNEESSVSTDTRLRYKDRAYTNIGNSALLMTGSTPPRASLTRSV